MRYSQQITDGIRVTVKAQYSEEHSTPTLGEWFFTYRVEIANESPLAVQLLSRHWLITDGHGKVEEVRGPGVVGQLPVIRPGQSFHYTSGCPLATPVGMMQGSYQMVTERGEHLDVAIGQFSLADPVAVH